MALIKCPECGKEVSEYAKACPNCGCPTEDIIKLKRAQQEQFLFENTGIGDIIEFGTYPQGLYGELQAIEWKVLDIDRDKESILLISKYVLDSGSFNKEWDSVTWETCSLRKWLNEDFFDKAFTLAEKSKIVETEVLAEKNPEYDTPQGNNTNDKVFLLSINEAYKYFKTDAERRCEGTKYSYRRGVCKYDEYGTCFWLLRSSGQDNKSVAHVSFKGFLYESGTPVGNIGSLKLFEDKGIRPVIRIKN